MPGDYGIPLKLSHTVVDIKGKKRVEGITLAQVDGYKPIPGTEEFYECDTLLLSCGLIPENELSRSADVELSPLTNGPLVGEDLQTNIPGIFAAGNVLHVHDLVDFVSEEAAAAGRHAASYIQNGCKSEAAKELKVVCEGGVRYSVPVRIFPDHLADDAMVTLRFRVANVYKNKKIVVYAGNDVIFIRKRPVLAPGEMETVLLKAKVLKEHSDLDHITVTLEEA